MIILAEIVRETDYL